MNDLIKEIAIKHRLGKGKLIQLETEYEITQLKVDFCEYKSQKEDISLYSALIDYGSMKKILRSLPNAKIEKVCEDIRNISDKSKIIELLFLNSWIVNRIYEKGLPTNCFNPTIEGDKLFIHFVNAMFPKHPLKGGELEKRKLELENIARDVKNNRPKVKFLCSKSWIWNLKKFQELMPLEFNKSLTKVKSEKHLSMSIYGQFYRYDGTINKERVGQFRENWEFPLKILEGCCDIGCFFDKY
jgi:hypothetical protein